MDVAVIGAGLVGMSIASQLGRAPGVHVTVLEQDHPGTGTSATSYAWVNANGKEPASYYELNLAGLARHHELARRGCSWMSTIGHIEFATDEAHGAHLSDRMKTLAARGYEVEELSIPQARQLLPDVLIPDECQTIAHFPLEAHCFPLLYLSTLLNEASRSGVIIRTGSTVTELRVDHDRPVVTLGDGDELRPDIVVSAVGRWTNQIARFAMARAPMVTFEEPGDPTVGYLVETSPVPMVLDKIVTSPWLNLRPEGGGRLMLQALDLDATADPGSVPTTDSPLAKEFLRRLTDVSKNTEAATVRHIAVGERAMPADGLTIVGTPLDAPWLYLVATHSGVTLAPVLGPGVAAEILGAEQPLFSDFRPGRFNGIDVVRPPTRPRRPGEQ